MFYHLIKVEKGVFSLKSSRRKSFIFFVVIVCLLLFFGPIIFSSISGAQTQTEKKAQQENLVTIHGEDTLTITTTDSFSPEQYYKAVDDKFQPVQMKYTDVHADQPGRYALTLTAKKKKDSVKRTVLIIVKERKPREKEKTENKTPASSTSKETAAKSTNNSVTPPPANPSPPVENPPAAAEGTVETTPQQEPAQVAQETPQVPPEAAKPAAEAPAPQPATQPNQIIFLGHSLPYQNGGQGSGQGIINGGSLAATWGGNPIQSGTDNQNTHFIGHNPGIFSPVLSLNPSDAITVTDSAGNPTTYIVNGLVQVDDSGVNIASGQDNWDQITSAGGGERITLQTCIGDSVNLIVYAQA